jgi:hypothetical protein
MIENEPLLQVGDFARNTLHNYLCWLLFFDPDIPTTAAAVTLNISEEHILKYWVVEGSYKIEVVSELEKVNPTLELINKAKEYLDKMNSATPSQLIDNLFYVELLDKLRTQEKALQNEN